MTDRTVTGPPKRRDVPVVTLEEKPTPQTAEAEEGSSHPLNLSGFTTGPREKVQKTRKQKPRAPAAPVPATRVKTTLNLPERVASAIREEAATSKRSAADVIVSAYLENPSFEIKAPTKADAQRIALGLPSPHNTADHTTDTQMGLYISRAALDALDKAANEASLSRSRFVAELMKPA